MSDIASFLSGKVLFLTGATGFLAKGLLAKILLDARDVRRIYLLIRPDGESSVEQRLEREVLQANALARVRELHGARFNDLMREKVVAVAGDLTQEKLGIKPIQYAQLAREVDIVINSAASVVFDEEIDQALQLNTLGPGRLVEFARACRDAVFLHVSTAYVNGQRTGRVPEELISPDQAVAKIIKSGLHKSYKLESEIDSIHAFSEQVMKKAASPELQMEFRAAIARRNNGRQISEQRLRREIESLKNRWIKRRLVDEGTRRARELGWHDTYTFTKAMGEQIIAKRRGDIPTIIVRPSIIESSLMDPESGWLDGLKVADPLIAHYSKGRLPDFPADPDIVLDLIPVDIVANAILAALPRARQTKEIQVYQVATGSENPLKLGEMFDLMHDYFRKYPMQNRRGQPIRVTRWTYPTPERFRRYCQLRYRMPLRTLRWMIKTFSALPWSPRLKQKVSVLEATLDRVLALTEIYSPYMHHDCRFETENTRRLYEGLGPEDRQRFNFDVGRIEWQEYIQDIHIPALKRHVLKEAGSPTARAETRNLSPQAL
jgi:nucleoside-diphosphate-sugar epimerase